MHQNRQNQENSGFQGVQDRTLGQTTESRDSGSKSDTEKWCFRVFYRLFGVFLAISTLGADNS